MNSRTFTLALGPPLARLAGALLPLSVGALLAALFIPYPWSFLAPLPLAALYLLIARSPTPGRAFSVGFWGGLGFFGLHLLWLPLSFSDLFGAVVVPPLLLLQVLLAVFWGATAGLSRLTGRYTLAVLPFAWVVMEYLRSLGVFGFTWGTLGYAFLPTPIVQVADLGGIYLVSLLLAAFAASLAALAGARRWWPVLATAGLLLAAAGYGVTRDAPVAANETVLLVQGSVNPLDKAAGRSLDELELYERLTLAGLDGAPEPVDLVVWPEGASPLPIDDFRVRRTLERIATPAIVGAPGYGDGFRNSAYGFDGGIAGSYSKRKLVPFGERFPLRDALSFIYDPLFTALGLPGLASVAPGDAYTPLRLGDIVSATYICYESAFPEVARQMVLGGANLLVNISNDAWFGRTAGAEQHFQMGRVRAIETRRYIARAGNDGISAAIDPLGRVVERYPRGARDAFSTKVGLSNGITPYVRWGDWVVGASALVLVVLAIVSAPMVARHGR